MKFRKLQKSKTSLSSFIEPEKAHIIPPLEAPVRLLDYCIGRFPETPSRNRTKKLLKEGRILLDGEPAEGSRWLQDGQQLEIKADLPKPVQLCKMSLKVVYQDDYLAVVNKPAGLPTSGNQHRTLANALAFNLSQSKEEGALPVPLPVHRLDYGTSGLVLVAKTFGVRKQLGRMLEHKTIQKYYQALVMGIAPEQGELKDPIQGQTAHSSYRCLKVVPSLRSGHISLVELMPHSGRTHQLRIHMADAALPILGDRQYGPAGLVFKGKGLFLAAVRLEFIHPVTGEPMIISIPPPAKFHRQLELEEKRWQKFNLKK